MSLLEAASVFVYVVGCLGIPLMLIIGAGAGIVWAVGRVRR